ncbi:MAG: PEGA domain-containing protein [Myxococcota bacterium]
MEQSTSPKSLTPSIDLPPRQLGRARRWIVLACGALLGLGIALWFHSQDSAEKGSKKTTERHQAQQDEPKFGFVTVETSTPGKTKVYVDGKLIGVAPIELQRLRIGMREIKIVEPSKKGPPRIGVRHLEITASHSKESPARIVVSD